MEKEAQDMPVPPEHDELSVPEMFYCSLLKRMKLADNEVKSSIFCAILFSAVSFLPLVVLNAVTGVNSDSSIKVPLQSDYVVLVRYLLVVPTLVLSEIMTRPWTSKAANRFFKIIREDQLDGYGQLFNRVFSLKSSLPSHMALLLLAVAISLFTTQAVLELGVSSWFSPGASTDLTAAGLWEAIISQPIYKFVLLKWCFDYLLWVYFLWRVSRMDLMIISTHPDCIGGLGFIKVAQLQYAGAAFALSCSICAVVAQMVRHMNVSLTSFSNLGLVFGVLVLVLFAGPLLFFTPALIRSKMNGIYTYGSLCFDMSQMFANKWLGAKKQENEPLVSSLTPSAVADLGTTYQSVISMRASIIDRQFIICYLVVICLPALPLVSTVIPLTDLLKQIIGALA